jgi:hypothetical protein
MVNTWQVKTFMNKVGFDIPLINNTCSIDLEKKGCSSSVHHLIICANFKNKFVFLLGEKFPIIFFHVEYQDTGVCMHCRPVS